MFNFVIWVAKWTCFGNRIMGSIKPLNSLVKGYDKSLMLEEKASDKLVGLKKRRQNLKLSLATNAVLMSKQEDFCNDLKESIRKDWLKIQDRLYSKGEFELADPDDVLLAHKLYDFGFLFRVRLQENDVTKRRLMKKIYGRRESFRYWNPEYERLSEAKLLELVSTYEHIVETSDKREVYKYNLSCDFLVVLRAEKHRRYLKEHRNQQVWSAILNKDIVQHQ
jgi:hypothetical protein